MVVGKVAAKKVALRELFSVGLGAMSLVFGVRALLGMTRPVDGVIGDQAAKTALVGVVVGVAGLIVGELRGVGRRVAVVGTGIALLALGLFAVAMALDAVLEL